MAKRELTSISTPRRRPQDDDFRLAFELFYFGHKGLMSSADNYLASIGLGRPHFRVLFMLEQEPGMTTNEILERLEVVAQSLTRTMRTLLDKKYVVQEADPSDRRLRRHYITAKGRKIETSVVALQKKALKAAFGKMKQPIVSDVYRVLFHLSGPRTQERLSPELEEMLDRFGEMRCG